LAPFAFKASGDSTPVCLTDPTLVKLPYQLPSTTTWTPSGVGEPVNLHLVPRPLSWRERAGVA
jgi:hypothetical protein